MFLKCYIGINIFCHLEKYLYTTLYLKVLEYLAAEGYVIIEDNEDEIMDENADSDGEDDENYWYDPDYEQLSEKEEYDYGKLLSYFV